MAFNPNLPSTSPYFSFSPELMASLDPEGRFLEANPAWEGLSGLAPAELVGTPFLERLHPADRPLALREIERLSRGKQETVRFETRVPDREGRLRHLAWTWTADPRQDRWY
ncbi:MAG TPA: PAS domain-containing protein, partial [bacterium]|nr:PAS domain-containing protein [bacterium]